MVTPSASPLTRPSPGNCSAVAGAATALTPPATQASNTAASAMPSGVACAIHANKDSGSSAASTVRPNSTGRLPTRSDNAPHRGVIAITATAAIVDSHSASPSSWPRACRNAGT